jgi:hypothetical protein
LIAATMAGLWVRGIGASSSAAGISSAATIAASEREGAGLVELGQLRRSDQPADSSPLSSRGPR